MKLSLPSSEVERTMAVRVADWKRIRANVERLGEPLTDNAQTWAATAVGGAIGLGATIASLLFTDNRVTPALIPCLIVATAALLLFAICFGLVARRETKRSTLVASAVCGDMDEVERGIVARQDKIGSGTQS
jgi:hypothetical protein